MSDRPTILMVSQATPLPARRRTWQQARALAERGWSVRVICPRRPGQPGHEVIDGIVIRRYRQPIEGRGIIGLLAEYLLSSLAITLMALAERLRGRIAVVQVVNPPDWLILPALLLRLFGARVIFDLADLSSLLVAVKFPRRRLLRYAIRGLERWALASADLVVAANEPYRRLAVRIGRRARRTTLTVASFPECLPRLAERAPGPVRIGYFGIIGQHDGVDRLLAVVRILSLRTDLPPFELVVVGDGPALPMLRGLAADLGLTRRLRWRGFLEGPQREAALGTFDIAVVPDGRSRYARTISMNKVFAYAAHGCAIASTPLTQTRRLLGEAAAYASDDSPAALAATVSSLLVDQAERRRLGQAARRVAERAFVWTREAELYAVAVTRLLDARVTMMRGPRRAIRDVVSDR